MSISLYPQYFCNAKFYKFNFDTLKFYNINQLKFSTDITF